MRCFACVIAAAVLAVGAASAIGQTTTTYQGRLLSDGQPYSGSADVRFTLFNPSNVAVLGPVESSNVSVVGGTFTTDVNLGDLVTGPGFTLEVAVRTPAGSGTFETLTPRQPVTATPLAASASTRRATWASRTPHQSDPSTWDRRTRHQKPSSDSVREPRPRSPVAHGTSAFPAWRRSR